MTAFIPTYANKAGGRHAGTSSCGASAPATARTAALVQAGMRGNHFALAGRSAP